MVSRRKFDCVRYPFFTRVKCDVGKAGVVGLTLRCGTRPLVNLDRCAPWNMAVSVRFPQIQISLRSAVDYGGWEFPGSMIPDWDAKRARASKGQNKTQVWKRWPPALSEPRCKYQVLW